MSNQNNIAAVVLAGGKGTRFLQVVDDSRQKVLCQLHGKPIIQYTTDLLDSKVIPHLVFNTGFLATDVEMWVKKQNFSHRISFSRQTCWSIYSAVTDAVSKIDEPMVVCCNADEVRLGLNVKEVLDFHQKHGRSMTIVGAFRSHLYRHRILNVDEDGFLLSSEYCSQRFRKQPQTIGLVNAGIAVFERRVVEMFDQHHPSNGWSAIFDPLCRAREIIVLPQPLLTFFNVGTLEEFVDAQLFLKRYSP